MDWIDHKWVSYKKIKKKKKLCQRALWRIKKKNRCARELYKWVSYNKLKRRKKSCARVLYGEFTFTNKVTKSCREQGVAAWLRTYFPLYIPQPLPQWFKALEIQGPNYIVT